MKWFLIVIPLTVLIATVWWVKIGMFKAATIDRKIVKNETGNFLTTQPLLPQLSTNTPQVILNTNSPTPIAPNALEVNISVPFVAQAPTANWDAIHEELCEEAVALMAQWFNQSKTGSKLGNWQNAIPAQEAETAFKQMVDWENKTFGDYKDTTALQTLQIFKEDLQVSQAELMENVSIENLKQELARGNIVIVPTAGRLLKNPYFKQPGPVYHMILLKGYKDNTFITNDPGTRYGEGYVYSNNILFNAIHDWNGSGDTIEQGQKVAIVIKK